MTWLPLGMLASILVVAAVTDLVSRRIPNALILVGLGLSLGWHLLGAEGNWSFDPRSAGAAGFLGWLLGTAVLFAVFLPFYPLRVFGAGDVKLMAVVGAFFGARPGAWTHLIGVALSVLVAGGALALLRIVARRHGAQVLSSVMTIFTRGHGSGPGGLAFDPRIDSVDRMPYALAIGAGVVFYLAGLWTGWVRIL